MLRLYDETESERHFSHAGNMLLALDEGEERVVDAAMAVLDEMCTSSGALASGVGPVEEWLARRNDVSSLGALLESGVVLDTIEVAARWSVLEELRQDVVAALRGVEGMLTATCHESHAYPDGACLYFTFAGRGTDPGDDVSAERFYTAAWDTALALVSEHGGSLSHHHGVGIVRAPYLRRSLGEGVTVLEQLKRAIDPGGIFNPGKLGDPSPVALRSAGDGARR